MKNASRNGGAWRGFLKKVAVYFSAFILVFNTSFSAFFIAVPIALSEDLCQTPVDVVLIIDTSGSMAQGEALSQCDWWQIEWVVDHLEWVEHTDYDVTEQWCDDRDLSPHHPSVYASATQSKMDSAKEAASSFVNNLGDQDQSGLVSFDDLADLVKGLSNDHPATNSAINGLAVTTGATNIGDAIAFATQELEDNSNSQAVKAMILLTDGKANRPNGLGYGEDPEDVAYAEEKAQDAADLDYKIFTIGLGSNGDINETMLQNIADLTGAEYYQSSNGNDLSGIYDEIAWEVCQYGSISGCKYNDLNNNGTIDSGEEKIVDWEIILGGDAEESQLTDENGCYSFAGLLEGDYVVSEGENLAFTPFTKTFPIDDEYNITLAEGENSEDVDFLNYFPVCGNEIIDVDFGEVCELDDTQECDADGYNGTETCNQECSGWGECETDESCGDGAVNGTEECDDGNTESDDGCSDECLLEGDPVCGNNVLEQGEECDDGNTEPGDGCDELCNIEEAEGANPGDIVINEIMQNPQAVLDSNGEWFEVYNTTLQDIDLINCVMSDNDGETHTIATSLIVPSLGYAVLTKNGEESQNGGIIPDYVYSGHILSNSSDEIVLTCDDTEIDRVEYDNGATFPDPSGASMILADSSLDNNIGANWCVSSSSFGSGDLGTPGSENDTCGDVAYCGNEITEGEEECDDGDNNGIYGYCNSDCSGQTSSVCGNGTLEGEEECDDGNTEPGDGCDETCIIEIEEPECVDNDSDGYGENCDLGTDCDDESSNVNPGASEACGDGVDNNCNGSTDEGCDVGGGGGGGGGGPVSLYIHSEKIEGFTTSTAEISWHTNKLATSRIVYGILPSDPIGAWPNLGYASTTEEISEKTTFHSVALDNLLSGASYYLRVVSSASGEIFGNELTFTTSEEDVSVEEEADTEDDEQAPEEEAGDGEENSEEEEQEEENSQTGGSEANNEPSGNSSGANEEEGVVLGEQIENEEEEEEEDEDESQPEDDQSSTKTEEETKKKQTVSTEDKGDDNKDGEDEDKEDDEDDSNAIWWWLLILLIITSGYYGYKKYQSENGRD
ncbi:VWA domain-containing protein [Candidatus Falkowbacteria bacterium]|jgi:cysteine-rich repeat protein|nr:VWA domain-containing protein [Candidatus Falkowbacteria bacterium]MBT4433066.1 VWA domain-containing protein [Candidatus Falkowbacteria bacterium]